MEATCFGPLWGHHQAFLRMKSVGTQHSLTWFERRSDDDPIKGRNM